ncbi:MAG: hypothetical protein PHO08_14120 [Methylococcales bacterium]|nr:hypothetical protein [Methylococcales bacterium]
MNTQSVYSTTTYKLLYPLLLLLIVSSFLTGCEKSSQKTTFIKEVVKEYEHATTLEGVVSNNHGPIRAGTIKVTDKYEELIASTAVQYNGHYHIRIPEYTVLPIVLTFYPDSADGEKFITAVVHPEITKYDLNPLTTSIARKAQAMGGYTHANLVRAAEGTARVPDANKTTAGFHGDPTTQYGGWH